MQFRHADDIWDGFPELVPGVIFVEGIRPDVDVASRIAAYENVARERLVNGPESGFPEIQAWRRAFSKMGLKPTQYRCASEALLRRFRKEDALPRLHPLIDLCNAISMSYAVPIAVFDTEKVSGELVVRRASGEEVYLTFNAEIEHPEPGEVIFSDERCQVHARRWTNRQSGLSAVREETTSVLIVAEALHETAGADVRQLMADLSQELDDVWDVSAVPRILTADAPSFTSG